MSKKEQIIKESIQLFSDYGYEATSMTKIAEQVDIKKPSLYAHFKNKDAIFYSAVKQVTGEYVDFVLTTIDQTKNQSSKNTLYNVLHHAYTNEYQTEFLGEFFYRFVLFTPNEVEAQIKPLIKKSEEQLEAALIKIVEKGQANQEIDPTLSNRVVLKNYLFIFYNLDVDVRYYSLKGSELEQYLNDIWSVFWRGVKN
ncbi:TetR/AcrR family transcriptional regulator [Alkalibacillus haloalkaliphilus]|uniref:TetR/AcrR family transcriptional regulator n=1 Tax=Alkalibacillus haloalkaliphilus TaxID=94136 RepID=UPI002936AD1B|nr:TetR/AcrR family transcriptional regulator [Alkalibacillus haloalkaliphilus]MDV2581762.1 TetR/AcrR family transcriptional regulator [Alkalibacillus haloalkaliphilus]